LGKAGTVAFGILSLILLGGLIVTINNYSEIVKNKDAIIESGKHQISMLREWLEGNITYYNSRLLHLNSTMASLRSRLSSLLSENRRLQNTINNYREILKNKDATIKDKERLINRLQAWLRGNVTYYNRRLSNLNSTVTSLRRELSSLLSKNRELQTMITSLSKNYSELQRRYESLLNATLRSSLKDPTWEELKSFLESDKTDELEYKPQEFDCTGFAITLRDNAWRCGLRCGFVEIGLSTGVGHNLAAFRTTDKGLIFVDCLNGDAIAYVQIGKPYGKIALKNVKSRYIDCSGDPARFWGPLNYTTHPYPFSYSYYEEYKKRVKFYEESAKAYNEAVKKYNRGEGNYTYSQLQKWYENLEALREEITPVYEEPGIVNSIEIYWD